MTRISRQLRVYVNGLGAGAAIVTAATVVFFPPTVTSSAVLAFATLLALAIVSSLLALTVTESGASTDVSFIPYLAALVLLGPVGALTITIVDTFASEFIFLRKPSHKARFNLAQSVLATAAAAATYHVFGGTTSLVALDLRATFPPFMLAVLAYFFVNSVFVSYFLSIAEQRSLPDVWREAAGSIIIFDVAMSSLALAVAFLYVRWGPIALLSALIPIIGLRYSYGVNLELQQLNQDLLRVLVKTLEARDPYTSGHSIRVAERARRIAVTLGLRGRRVRLIETAALLHDIGKIDLAYGEILRQAGPLTPPQRELIRAHPDKGVAIIGSVRSLDPDILRCIRHHHEWYDGTGYPVGLAGDDIPVGARIIMIADSIDAMLTDRPYRSALSVDKVRQELLRNSGTQFDSGVVEATFAAGVLDSNEDFGALGTQPALIRPRAVTSD
jgi:putative nucleotidyltransferase with HDIG domain